MRWDNFVPEQILAPTNGFNNILNFMIFMNLSKNYQKSIILLAAPFYTLFDHDKITTIYNTLIFMFHKTDVPVREVLKKSILALPCCMGMIFFFDSRLGGNAISCFFNTSPARMRFFHVFNTSAARSPKINKSVSRSPCLDAPARKTQNRKSHKIVTYPPRLETDVFFEMQRKT